jgi:recombinational DNA repair ATPase RecF
MKILNLEIQNVRGIKDRLVFSPEGDNLLVYGPNGTGKSAIVDAIDFLLTGKISRLIGKGTKDISLKQHGPHVDVKSLATATVKGTIKIPNHDDPIEIGRNMSNPNVLLSKCPEDKKSDLEKVLSVAKRGHYVFTRKEILKFVAAEPGERATEVQAILNLDIVEEIRKIFVRVKTDADKEDHTAQVQLSTAKLASATTLSIDRFSEELVLDKVNDLRLVLKGKPLPTLEENLQKDIKPPFAQESKTSINIDVLFRNIDAVKKIVLEKGELVYDIEIKLRTILGKLKEDARLKRDLANARLIKLGLSLIDEDSACPLCLTKWKPGELKTVLEERLLKAEEASKIEAEIGELSGIIDREISSLKDHLEKINNSCLLLKLDDVSKRILTWIDTLTKWFERLADPMKAYAIAEKVPPEIKVLCSPKTYAEDLEIIRKTAIEVCPEISPEQKSWDALTRMSTELKRYFEAQQARKDATLLSKRAATSLSQYEKSRDKILTSLYEDVKNDFIDYYKDIHKEDESGFKAKLLPSGAGLDFKVDFYNRGYHPPIALHSEGHQDSMGLCLYLALSKRLSDGIMALTILDDVVMSIDSEHRRDLCKLLKSHFPDQQFFITTHDRTWARQLHTEGVVSKKNMIEFKSWSVDTGPSYMEGFDFWEKIQKDMENNDVPSAAATLRRNSEYIFERACDQLLGKVVYKGDGRWELGDYLLGATEALKRTLRQAKASANSWEDDNKIQEIEEIESVTSEIIGRSQVEQWGINENVHYSRWGDFSKGDFEPIVEAFRDLHDLFKCSKCQGLLYVTLKEKKPQDLRCLGGHVNYNLIKK